MTFSGTSLARCVKVKLIWRLGRPCRWHAIARGNDCIEGNGRTGSWLAFQAAYIHGLMVDGRNPGVGVSPWRMYSLKFICPSVYPACRLFQWLSVKWGDSCSYYSPYLDAISL